MGQGVQSVTDGVTPDQAPVTDVTDLEEQAAAVLATDDPMRLVDVQFRNQGYGGDIKTPGIVYLSFVSRLLKMRPGNMPVHLLLHGPSSTGKSYTVKVVILLFPPEAYRVIDAGSPRVLIYDSEPLEHRALIFGEADSIPAGEDNPAASAVRNLTADGYLHYEVVEKDEFGSYFVRTINKPGPTVLITTATRTLGNQLMTRLFTLDVADDEKQIKAALDAQARLETTEAGEVDPALIAFQSLLQAQAPWDVTVPFAGALAREIGRAASAPRILRDFQRLLSLVKSVAVLRHRHRQRDEKGRLVAEIKDYQTVYELVAEMYAATTTGASKAVREAVETVEELKTDKPALQITYSVLAKHLGVHRVIATRRAKQALRLSWLVNNETRKGHTADLIMGEPMPPETGLPEPVTLEGSLLQEDRGCDSDCYKLTEAESLAAAGIDDTGKAVCNTVTHETDVYEETDHDLMEVRI